MGEIISVCDASKWCALQLAYAEKKQKRLIGEDVQIKCVKWERKRTRW